MLTMIDADEKIIREARRSIQRAKICEPGKGEYVDECHWSKTGWAIWKFGDMKHGHYCTCRPAKAPMSPSDVGGSPK